jgi:hypothetical protein
VEVLVLIVNAPTATSTLVGSVIRVEDNSIYGNLVRGLEVQASRGVNNKGENTALSGFARTFGVRGTTVGDAGDTFLPAGVYAETQGTTQGNALRAYSGTITTEDLVSLYHDSSIFTGTGLEMDFGNSGGSFAATSSAKFLDFQVGGTSKFIVSANGSTTIGDGTVHAGLRIPRGGICVDNDGSCVSTTTGEIRAVTSALGNSDLAEIYFSSQALETGEIVSLVGGLSMERADESTEDAIIGVVSTKPGLLLGFDDTSLVPGESGYPVGLKGRVPVKLSTENGPIKKGDRIMLSSIPGVGMKATENARVVGVALEDWNGEGAYSDTYINQFGDDIARERMEARIEVSETDRDNCYYGGGSALDGAPCVSKPVTTTTYTPITNEEREAVLASLALVPAEMLYTEDNEEVYVGQAIMFIELTQYHTASTTTMLTELLDPAQISDNDDNETLWSRLKTLAQSFVDGVLSIAGIRVERIDADKADVQNIDVAQQLCIDGTCITGEQLRAIIMGSSENTPEVEEEDVPPDEPFNDSGGLPDQGVPIEDETIQDDEEPIEEVDEGGVTEEETPPEPDTGMEEVIEETDPIPEE